MIIEIRPEKSWETNSFQPKEPIRPPKPPIFYKVRGAAQKK